MRSEFHPEARADLRLAAHHYESCRPGLGIRFIEAVKAAVNLIVESPSAWPIVEGDVRRCLTRIFPYAVFYFHESDIVRIIAITALMRRPGYWHERR